MIILQFPSKQPEPPFFQEIIENAKTPGYYPNEFPDYPIIHIKDLKVGDEITIRVFFKVGEGEDVRADGGYLDLEVEAIANNNVMATILTKLPDEFPLGAGDSIEIFEDEILKKVETREH